MIATEILTSVRNGTCAIGYLSVSLEQFTTDPTAPHFHVVGSGFLVRQTIAITNRHVIEALDDSQAKEGFPDSQKMVAFVAPRTSDDLQFTIRMIRSVSTVANEDIDLGFVLFREHDPQHFQDIGPLTIQKDWELTVTERIALVGYPYGQAMLQRRGRVYRWGPVVQQGYISAVSPFDISTTPNEILMDVRVAGGMSGAPVFRPGDGIVIGILHSTWEATTALGLPLTRRIVEALVAPFVTNRTLG